LHNTQQGIIKKKTKRKKRKREAKLQKKFLPKLYLFKSKDSGNYSNKNTQKEKIKAG